MRRPRYCQRFDAGTLDLAEATAGLLGESMQEFIEMAVVMRSLDATCRLEYRDRLGSQAEDQYGIVHQYWENRRRRRPSELSDLPF